MNLYYVAIWEPDCDPGGIQGWEWVIGKTEDRAHQAARYRMERKYGRASLAVQTYRVFAGELPLILAMRRQCVELRPYEPTGFRLCELRARYALTGGKFMNRKELDRYLEEIRR